MSLVEQDQRAVADAKAKGLTLERTGSVWRVSNKGRGAVRTGSVWRVSGPGVDIRTSTVRTGSVWAVSGAETSATTVRAINLAAVHAMDAHLDDTLPAIAWSRDTQVTFEVRNAGRKLAITATMPTDSRANTRSRLMRLVGEAFATLPAADVVTASGYSGRADPVTVRVTREQWQTLDFGNLSTFDVTPRAWGAVRFARSTSPT